MLFAKQKKVTAASLEMIGVTISNIHHLACVTF